MELLEQAIQFYTAKKYKESYALFKSMDASPEVSYFLGMHFYHGYSVKQSDDKALAYFKQSWEGLYPEGIYMLGRMYEQGRSVEKNLKQAFKLYQAAHESINAKLRLAAMYEDGVVVDKDMATAIRYYNACQKLGSGYAMYKIGRFYLTGEGLKKNLKNGYAWLQKALAKNHILAINYFRLIGKKPSTDNRSVVDLYKQGLSAFQRGDKEYALSYLEVAINEGSIEALMLLVNAYQHGELFSQDKPLAFKLLLKHQGLNQPLIDYTIGKCYEKGLGVLSSYYKAGLFYEKAASKGDEDARIALSELRGY